MVDLVFFIFSYFSSGVFFKFRCENIFWIDFFNDLTSQFSFWNFWRLNSSMVEL